MNSRERNLSGGGGAPRVRGYKPKRRQEKGRLEGGGSGEKECDSAHTNTLKKEKLIISRAPKKITRKRTKKKWGEDTLQAQTREAGRLQKNLGN